LNLIEFDTWQAEHKLLHYEFAAFCDRQAETDEAYHQRQLDRWFTTIKFASLESALACSNLLAQSKLKDGNVLVEPKGPGDHIRLINKCACKLDDEKRLTRAANDERYTVGGEATYRCLPCYDSGILLVWHSLTLAKFVETGRLETWYRASVACNCQAGKARQEGRTKIQAYDEQKMPLWPETFVGVKHREGNERALRAWYAERGVKVPVPVEPPPALPAPIVPLEADDSALLLTYEEADALPF
jgi:hypothetical protein